MGEPKIISKMPSEAGSLEELQDIQREVEVQDGLKKKSPLEAIPNATKVEVGYIDSNDSGVVGSLILDYKIQKRWERITAGTNVGIYLDRKVPHFDSYKGELGSDPKSGFRLYLPTQLDFFLDYNYGDNNVDYSKSSHISLVAGLFEDLDPRLNPNGVSLLGSPNKYYGLNETNFMSVGVKGEQYFNKDSYLYYRLFYNHNTDASSNVNALNVLTKNRSLDALLGANWMFLPQQTLWLQLHYTPLWPKDEKVDEVMEEQDTVHRVGVAGGGKFTLIEDKLTLKVTANFYDVGDYNAWGVATSLGIIVVKDILELSLTGGASDASKSATWTDATGEDWLIENTTRQFELSGCAGLFGKELSVCYAHLWALMGNPDASYDDVNVYLLQIDPVKLGKRIFGIKEEEEK